jgi:hypothetical protein
MGHDTVTLLTAKYAMLMCEMGQIKYN